MANRTDHHPLSRTEPGQQQNPLHHLAVSLRTGEIVHLPSGSTRAALTVFAEICQSDDWNFFVLSYAPTQDDFDRLTAAHARRFLVCRTDTRDAIPRHIPLSQHSTRAAAQAELERLQASDPAGDYSAGEYLDLNGGEQ